MAGGVDPKRHPARWAWPLQARKSHWFAEGEIISACGNWMHSGEGVRYQKTEDEPGPDDCKACWRKATAT